MNRFCYRVLIVVAALCGGTCGLQAQTNNVVISGLVLDSSTQKPVVAAQVEVLVRNTTVASTSTSSKGSFSLSIQRTNAFRLRVSKAGYQLFFPGATELPAGQRQHYVGTIALLKTPANDPNTRDDVGQPANNNNKPGSGQPSQPPPARPEVAIKPTREVIENHLDATGTFPTKGAFELLYALNPQLRHQKELPSNYRFVNPDFPEFKDKRREFNRNFKQDKNRDEPYTSLQTEAPQFAPPGLPGPLFAGNTPTRYSATYAGGVGNRVARWPANYMAAKKFVFVMWKYDSTGKVVTGGPEVENRYIVYYFTDRVRNKASNATYGYAPMKDALYRIEVFDQRTGEPVKVSDDEVNPHVYFERKDIWVMFNISWIKIPIQVYHK